MLEHQEQLADAERRLGQRLSGAWRLTSVIGMGGMAAVYDAEGARGERRAIKVLHAALARSGRQRACFLREARITNAVGHPGVVRIHDASVDRDGTAFLVMERLHGVSLASWAEQRRAPLAPALLAPLMVQLLRVLERAHARGIVHLDLKPSNLFLTRDRRLKVLDFGVARAEPKRGRAPDLRDGCLLGTPAFMAPEQARGVWRHVDGRSDLWATAATMFTLLAGQYVHGSGTPDELVGRAMTVSARPIAALRDDLPAEFAALVDRGLAYDPEARWPSARAMREALQRCSAAPASACAARGGHLAPHAPALAGACPLERTLAYSLAGATRACTLGAQLGKPQRSGSLRSFAAERQAIIQR